MNKILIFIDSNYFSVLVVIENNKVVRFPPIIKYMENWTLEKVLDYSKKKNWKVEIRND